MKKIVLTTTLLSIVMCENILLENHPRSKELWVRNNHFWSRNMKQAPHNDLSSELVEFVNRDDDKQLPRILETRFTSESNQSPVIIRQHDTTQFLQDLSSPEKLKFNRFKPTILISIGIEETKNGDNSKDCSKKQNHRKNKQNWQIQKPVYVEEPKWIAIDSDYVDGTSRHLDDTDPYILSRGKKMFRLKDSKQVDKLIENNEGFIKNNEEGFDYPSRSKRSSTKSRAKRSVGTNENSRKNAVNKKDNRKEKINRYNSFQSIERGAKPKNENENNYFASDTNKRSKSMSLKSKTFPEIYKKHRTHKLNWMNAKSKGERNETDVFEQMEKLYVDKLDDLHDVYDDSFILSRGKHMFDSRTEGSNKAYASHGEATYKKPWKDLETSENKKEKRNKSSILEIEKNTTEKIDSQLTHKPVKISTEKNIDTNYREKRNACKSLVCKLEPQLPNQLLKSFEEEIQDTLSLERRDKTSEFLKKLTEPSFVISRGKKALRSKFEDDLYSMFQSRNIKIVSLPIVKSLLRMLLMEKCNNSNDCDVDVSKLAGRRDRRDSFDIFTKEEPFYVGRGKRMESDEFLTQSLQRENIILSETDAKQ